jgi:hypothetical protein
VDREIIGKIMLKTDEKNSKGKLEIKIGDMVISEILILKKMNDDFYFYALKDSS